jgi:nitroreductase
MIRIIVLILSATFLFSGCCSNCKKQNGEEMKSKRDVVLENIHARKSVRNFVDGRKAIAQEDLDALVRAGMAAPTAVNLQPWHFVIVNDNAMLDTLCANLPYAKMLQKASAAIIVCGDSTVKAGNTSFWDLDCSLASANILLAAEAMDLGALWTAIYPDPGRINFIRNCFKLPENIIPLNLMPIGYPTGEDKAKDKYKAERVHYNKW